jgi:23S rRNA pseudouridine1911/1915/1917 synthase
MSNVETRHALVAAAADAGERLDRLLARDLPQLSRSRIKSLIQAGQVAADGATIANPSYRVKPGQTLAVTVPATVAAKPEGQDIALTVLYEDEDLIVIDKPAGLVVHPAAGNPDRTLVNALIAHCGASLSGIGGERRPGIVHRLDKDTSGVMVAAKTDAAHRALALQFADHSIDRAYSAVVWGRPMPPRGTIDGRIGRSRTNRKKMAVLATGGKAARTHYAVLRGAGALASLVECRLETGRTHQIRVHLSHLGHPVVGDPVYGRGAGSRLSKADGGHRAAILAFRRQALHAHLLGFDHPRGGRRVRFTAGIPRDMEDLLESLESL